MANPFSGFGSAPSTTPFDPSQLVPRWVAGLPTSTTWSAERAFREGYDASAWVYTCTEYLSIGVASLPWEMQDRDPETRTWKTSKGQDEAAVLEHFNPKMSRNFAMHRAAQHMCLTGNSLFLRFRGSLTGKTRELWQVNPKGVRPVPDRILWISAYQYFDQGERKFWDADDVVHTMLPNPNDDYWGQPILKSVAGVVDGDVKATAWNRMLFDRRGVPDLIFVDKTIASKDQFDQVKQWVREQAEQKDRREPWVVGGDVDVKEMSRSPVDLDWLPGRQQNVVEIASCFRLLPALFSPQAATYDNLMTAIQHMWRFGCIPIANFFADSFTRALVPPELWGKRRVFYNTEGVAALSPDLEKLSGVLEKLVRNMTPYNAAVTLLGLKLPTIPGGDVPMVGSQLVTLADVQNAGIPPVL